MRLDDLERRLPEHVLQPMGSRPKSGFRELLKLQARALDRSGNDHGASDHVLMKQNHYGVTVDTPRLL